MCTNGVYLRVGDNNGIFVGPEASCGLMQWIFVCSAVVYIASNPINTIFRLFPKRSALGSRDKQIIPVTFFYVSNNFHVCFFHFLNTKTTNMRIHLRKTATYMDFMRISNKSIVPSALPNAMTFWLMYSCVNIEFLVWNTIGTRGE
uniref:Uncharacterized protein n=1 Tax=Vannella robusta TaxID=1487602 RepID=A0A7S4HXB9_9EUKA